MKSLNILLLSCLVLLVPLAQAAPVVSTVDTSQMGAGVITLSGNGFGPGPHVEVFDRFESDKAVAGDAIPFSSPEIGNWTSGSNAPQYSTQAHSGRFGALTDVGDIFNRVFSQGGVQEVFMSFWVRVPNGTNFPGASSPGQFSSTSSWKFAWLIDQDYMGNSSDVCIPTHTGSGDFFLAGNDMNLTFVGTGTDWWSWNSWVRVATWLRANPSNPLLDGDVLFHTVSEEHGVKEQWMKREVFDADGPALKQFRYVNVPGWLRSGAPIYDDVYIAAGSNALAHVELADSPDYKQARRVAIQPSSSWSDTSITVSVNQGGFSNLDNVYLFVWDKDGNRNATGYPVNGITSAAPMYPSGIY